MRNGEPTNGLFKNTGFGEKVVFVLVAGGTLLMELLRLLAKIKCIRCGHVPPDLTQASCVAEFYAIPLCCTRCGEDLS